MDQLSALRIFIRIVESGSFTKASDLLEIPRATATKLVQDLETHLGVKLLARTTRAVSVTPEGAAYYQRARRLVQELDDMDVDAGHSGGLIRGTLRVDVGSSIANIIVLPALPDFHRRYPDINLQLGVSDRPIDIVGEGADCTIRGGPLTDTSMIARRLAEMDFVTCAAPSYLATHGMPEHPRHIEDSHLTVPYFSSLTGRPFPMHFSRGDETLEIHGKMAVSVNESTAHITALCAGLGIGQTYRFMAEPHLKCGALQAILADWTAPRQPVSVVYPPNRHLNARLRVFVDWAVERFSAFDDRH